MILSIEPIVIAEMYCQCRFHVHKYYRDDNTAVIYVRSRYIKIYHVTNFSRSLKTPIAVTAAPAPAPCTIKGLAPYRSVWNIIMLSEPPNEVANGWVLGYL